MVSVRHYKHTDWPEISAWWAHSGEVSPLPLMMPEESSFIAEVDGEPALAVALYLTNTPELAYIENFVGNPKLAGPKRREAAHVLVETFCKFAKERGYNRLLCMSEKPVLVKRYMELGFQPTLSGLTTLVRSM
jgi:hypothetical protein